MNWKWSVLLLLACCRYEGRQDAKESEIRDALLAEFLADTAGACIPAVSGGVPTLTVRATSTISLSRCDLADGSLVTDPSRWDISFQRFKIGTASGTSAAASGGACKANQTNFDAVAQVSTLGGASAPNCPFFSVDQVLSAESGGAGGSSTTSYSGNVALQEWYTYNIFGHTLSAKSDVYVVRASDGTRYYKVQMLDYYSSAGTSGYPKFRYKEISF